MSGYLSWQVSNPDNRSAVDTVTMTVLEFGVEGLWFWMGKGLGLGVLFGMIGLWGDLEFY